MRAKKYRTAEFRDLLLDGRTLKFNFGNAVVEVVPKKVGTLHTELVLSDLDIYVNGKLRERGREAEISWFDDDISYSEWESIRREFHYLTARYKETYHGELQTNNLYKYFIEMGVPSMSRLRAILGPEWGKSTTERRKSLKQHYVDQTSPKILTKSYPVRHIHVKPKGKWVPHPAHCRDMVKFTQQCEARVEYDKHRGENLNLAKFSGVNRKQRRYELRTKGKRQKQKPYGKYVTITFKEPIKYKYRGIPIVKVIVFTWEEKHISRKGYELKKIKHAYADHETVYPQIKNPIDPITNKPYVLRRKTIYCINYSPRMQRVMFNVSKKVEAVKEMREKLIEQKKKETLDKARKN